MPTIKTNFPGEANNWKRDLKNCYKNSLFWSRKRKRERKLYREREREKFIQHTQNMITTTSMDVFSFPNKHTLQRNTVV